MKEYNFEIYTKHPVTNDSGWDIRFASCFADSKESAKEIIKSYPLFDCIILYNFGGIELSGYELDLYNDGVMFFDRHSYMNNTIIKTYK